MILTGDSGDRAAEVMRLSLLENELFAKLPLPHEHRNQKWVEWHVGIVEAAVIRKTQWLAKYGRSIARSHLEKILLVEHPEFGTRQVQSAVRFLINFGVLRASGFDKYSRALLMLRSDCVKDPSTIWVYIGTTIPQRTRIGSRLVEETVKRDHEDRKASRQTPERCAIRTPTIEEVVI